MPFLFCHSALFLCLLISLRNFIYKHTEILLQRLERLNFIECISENQYIHLYILRISQKYWKKSSNWFWHFLLIVLTMDYGRTDRDTQWRHKSKKSENLGRFGRQNMLRPYLKIWDWDLIFGRAVKAISSLGIRSPWFTVLVVKTTTSAELATFT